MPIIRCPASMGGAGRRRPAHLEVDRDGDVIANHGAGAIAIDAVEGLREITTLPDAGG